MAQEGAVFAEGATYLRMKDTGYVYPINAEIEKLVRKETAEYVLVKGGKFIVVKPSEDQLAQAAKPVSTPARKPEAPVKITAPVMDDSAPAPPPPVKKVELATPSSGLDLSVPSMD